MSTDTVWFLSAEIVLVVAALTIYVGGAMTGSKRPWAWIAGGGVLLAAAALWCWGGNERFLARHITASAVATPHAFPPSPHDPQAVPVIADPLAAYGRWLALAFAAVLVLMASRPLAGGGTPEYLGSLLLAVAGLMLVAGAGNLVLLFVGLELISIPTYILLSLGRRDAANQEAAAKYFFLSVLASAMLLYGLSFLYGTTGSMDLAIIRSKLVLSGTLPPGFLPLVKVAFVLVIAGLSFRVTAVPFHFYAPDVYQGTIHANAAMLSVLPKAAGLLGLVRLVLVAMPDMAPFAWKVALGLSMLTMTLGNVVALWQDNLRRLLAYSSIANAGYMLIGLTVALAVPDGPSSWDGIGAMWFYLGAYAAATLGTFAALIHLGRDRQQIESVDELAGLGRCHPRVAAALAVCMFSLAGLPPAGGLWGKLFLFGSALSVEAGTGGPHRAWLVALAVVGVLNAAVGAFYYLRIVGVMYFRAPLAAPRAEGGRGAWIAAMACALVVLVLGVYPGPWMRFSTAASPTACATTMNSNPQSPIPNP